jgi:hypothetical protein
MNPKEAFIAWYCSPEHLWATPLRCQAEDVWDLSDGRAPEWRAACVRYWWSQLPYHERALYLDGGLKRWLREEIMLTQDNI